MRGAALRTGAVVIGAGTLALALVLGGVDRADLVLDAYLLFTAGLVAALSVRLVAAAFPPPRGVIQRALLRRPLRPVRPPELDRLSDVVTLATASTRVRKFGGHAAS